MSGVNGLSLKNGGRNANNKVRTILVSTNFDQLHFLILVLV